MDLTKLMGRGSTLFSGCLFWVSKSGVPPSLPVPEKKKDQTIEHVSEQKNGALNTLCWSLRCTHSPQHRLRSGRRLWLPPPAPPGRRHLGGRVPALRAGPRAARDVTAGLPPARRSAARGLVTSQRGDTMLKVRRPRAAGNGPGWPLAAVGGPGREESGRKAVRQVERAGFGGDSLRSHPVPTRKGGFSTSKSKTRQKLWGARSVSLQLAWTRGTA